MRMTPKYEIVSMCATVQYNLCMFALFIYPDMYMYRYMSM